MDLDTRPPWRRPPIGAKQPSAPPCPWPPLSPKQPKAPPPTRLLHHRAPELVAQQPDWPPPQRLLDELSEFRGANLNPDDVLDPAWTADYFEYCRMGIDEFGGEGGGLQMLGNSLPMPPPPPKRWNVERPPPPVLPGTWKPTLPPPRILPGTLRPTPPRPPKSAASSSSSKCEAAADSPLAEAAALFVSWPVRMLHCNLEAFRQAFREALQEAYYERHVNYGNVVDVDLRFIFALAHTRGLFLIYRL